MMHKFARKQPRFHPGLEWEGRTLTNDFVDVSRMALDDEFSGKNAAQAAVAAASASSTASSSFGPRPAASPFSITR